MAAPIWRRCFCTSRVVRKQSWSLWRERFGRVGGPGLGDAAALSVSVTQLVAAHRRADVLANPADADLGVYEQVSLCQQQLRLSRLWRAIGCRHAVGRAVPWAARPVDVVSRGDVGAQSRAPVCHPIASL